MKIINKIKNSLILGLVVLFGFTNSVFAADYSISLTSDTVVVGNTVTLRITGNNVAGRFNITSSNANVASPAVASVWVENDTQYITINTKNTGTATLTITSSKTTATDDPRDITLPARTVNITVNPKPSNNTGNNGGSSSNGGSSFKPRPKSSNSYLASLTVDGFELNENFDKESLEYTLTVPANTEKIKINAQLAEDSAKATGTGEVNVSEGLNTFEIVVTAENGSKRTYVLKVTVEAEKPIQVKIDNNTYNVVRKRKDLPKISEYFCEKEVDINGEKVEGYYNDTLKYTVVGLKDTNGKIEYYIYANNKYTRYLEYTFNGTTLQILDKVVDGGKKTTFTYDGDKIDSYQEVKLDIIKNTYALDNNDISGNQFYLFYAKNVETGKEELYQYDAKEKTVQRYNTKVLDLYKEQSDKYYICLLGSILLLGLVIVLFSIILIGKGKKNKKKVNLVKENKSKEIVDTLEEDTSENEDKFSFDDLPIKDESLEIKTEDESDKKVTEVEDDTDKQVVKKNNKKKR